MVLKVPNQKYVRELSWKALKASKTRNLIAILAIVLTTVLFTTLFTMGASLNEGMQQNNFRLAGGYSHGTFKYLTEEKFNNLKENSLIKEWGVRRVAGMPTEEPFHKSHVEIGYSDVNAAKWMFCEPVEGDYPAEGTNEAATDLYVLKLLGVEPVIGNEFTVTFDVDGHEIVQTFVLSGWWETDEVNPAHHILIPESRLNTIFSEAEVDPENSNDGIAGSWILEVMLSSSMHIEADMECILASQGYQQQEYLGEENGIAFGVNWGYTGAQLYETLDLLTILAIAAILLLIIFTGYLIIYNVFQISVNNDIRFYGLLKTIGTTPKQLKRIIHYQAIFLSFIGIPVGLLIGWQIGFVVTPIIVSQVDGIVNIVSINPIIFIGASVFSLVTVLLSCNRPGKIASKVSPVEAIRYIEGSKKQKTRKRAKKRITTTSLATANLGRTFGKTMVTIVSMALSVVLLTVTVIFTIGFDMDKYLESRSVTDYIVATASYFQSDFLLFSEEKELSSEAIEEIEKHNGIEGGGRIYGEVSSVHALLTEDIIRSLYSGWSSPENTDILISQMERTENGMLLKEEQLYGMESFALDQLKVIEGDLSELYEPGSRAIAAVFMESDYGFPYMDTNWARIGDIVTLRHTQEWEYYYTDTGEIIEEFNESVTEGSRPWSMRSKIYEDIDYTVVALVCIPVNMSYRYTSPATEFVINNQTFIQDTGTDSVMLYAFDVIEESNAEMEEFIRDYTNHVDTSLDYENKQTYVKEFEDMKNLFALLGGGFSFIVGLVGILNFFNAELTSIISRKREFAVMQSIGMTGRQLKQMLVYEGLYYAAGSLLFSLVIILLLNPLLRSALEKIIWYFTYRFTLVPILIIAPVFILLGWIVPIAVYSMVAKTTIVERLREAENSRN